MFYYVKFAGWDIKNYKPAIHCDESHEDCTTYSENFIYLGNDNRPIINIFCIKRHCKKLMEKHFDRGKLTFVRINDVSVKQKMFVLSNGYYWNVTEMTKQDYLHKVGCTSGSKYTGIEIFDEKSFLQKIKDLFKRTDSY